MSYKISASDFEKFQTVEIETIKFDKWLEGEKIHNDPGEHFVYEWVHNNAKEFRNRWEYSLCKCCNKWNKKLRCGNLCGSKELSDCKEYEPEH